ncbi:FAD-binding oxidoreductase [Paeniroseomonas aquatica]|uniref:FAD-binding oxidoreductase n=1 Tax=Paeniroseomonas aquatica TaxID=373043 RepID=A0ABT8A670_9PROT|nr:FAD-binding oxidoreductase [Paeniroseomonas aquatica]MDN3565079.1 FAD-binding oxidoreductase [Paeniroseomonas aquatica]
MTSLDALAEALGPRNILTTPEDMAPYAVDWRGSYRGTPQAVLRPGTAAEVAAALRIATQAGLAVVPAGGRTGLAGGAVVREAGPPAVVLSLERLNRIRDVDARDFSVVAEAGCIIQQVQQAAVAVDRLFPIAWGAQGSAQIGGMLSTNAGGIRTIRWGNARDLVLGLEVALPDGRVLHDLRRVRKDNSGYALRHLFIGAEGTLGIITAAALRLVPPLRAVETAFVAVPSPDAALALLSRVYGAGADVVAFELISHSCMAVVARYAPQIRLPLPVESPWFVMLELAASHAAVPVRAMLEAALFAADEAGEITDGVLAENEAQRLAFWRIREDYPEFARAAGPAIATDTAVPVSAVPEFLARAEAALAARWPEGRMLALGHAGDGNIHLSLRAPEGMSREDWAARAGGADMVVNEIAVELGGSFSAEHGIGSLKLHVMQALKDPLALELMRGIKGLLDPRGLMNPGKVLPGN